MRAMCTNSIYLAPAGGTHPLQGICINGTGDSGRAGVGCGEVSGNFPGWTEAVEAAWVWTDVLLLRAGTARGAPGISGAPGSASSALPSFAGPGFTARAGAFLPSHLWCVSQRTPISLFFNCLEVFFGGFSGYFEDHFSQMCLFF